jgi:nicotinamidase-related amidase
VKIAAERSVLLVVDVQEKLVGAMHDAAATIGNIVRLGQAAAALEVPALLSEQYPKGLGRTVAELTGFRASGGGSPVEKVHFSCLADDEYRDRLAALGRRQAVLVGIEAHVCVLQTALDLLEAGYAPFVVADAVTSRASASKALGLDRLRANGVEIVSAEMVMFEWLHTAQNPAFKAVSKLLR